ncbi:hypothetical protein [Streptomyces avidinii]|uniref:Penicillinase repressor n=1 Tax=Streptomyces avidinii TaxID=1895 RepID=A0ABS4LFX6_STRAV|nr:hypothetical protein [Streptomyces avidinii]MBP2041008.1 hypothetical protein [Streptomyces avidinii]
MSTGSNVTRVKDDYAEQIAGDLAANQAAQEQRRGELQRLQQEIGELEESEKVLLRMQDALGVAAASAAARPAARGTKRAAVPTARSAGAGSGSGSREKKAPATTAKAEVKAKAGSGAADAAAAVKAPRARKATGKAVSKATGDTAVKEETGSPSWLELVTTVLAGGTEPRSAAEVAEAVSAAHPARTVQAGVVRNTLEQGVARGLLERSKQGRSVYYSPVTSTPAQPEAALPQQP